MDTKDDTKVTKDSGGEGPRERARPIPYSDQAPSDKALERDQDPLLISVGPSVLLVSVKVLKASWRLSSDKDAFSLLKASAIPVLRKGNMFYFNLYALESVLFALMRPGSTHYFLEFPSVDDIQDPVAVSNTIGLVQYCLEDLLDPESPIHLEKALAGLSYTGANYNQVKEKLSVLADRMGKWYDKWHRKKVKSKSPSSHRPIKARKDPPR